MSAMHTPGPWRVGARNPYPDEPLEISVLGVNPRDGSDYCVAVAIPCGHGDRSRDLMPEVTEGNARLIAAAPDLLAALQKVDADWTEAFPHGPEGDVSCWGGMGRMSEETRQIWLEIRAALAKAGAL